MLFNKGFKKTRDSFSLRYLIVQRIESIQMNKILSFELLHATSISIPFVFFRCIFHFIFDAREVVKIDIRRNRPACYNNDIWERIIMEVGGALSSNKGKKGLSSISQLVHHLRESLWTVMERKKL